MADLLLKNLSMFLAPAPIARFRRSRVPLRPRGGSNLWRLCRKTSVGASELEIIYSSESSDGSVVFRFGTASEIAAFVESQEVLNVNGGVETEGVAQVGDGVQEEYIVSDDTEDTMEGIADGVLDMELPAEDLEKFGLEIPGDLQENGLDCTSDSSETLRGEQISSDFDVVSDAACPDIISNVSVEEPSVVHEDNDGSSETGTLGALEDSSSYEIHFESYCVKELTTNDSDGDLECSSEIENALTESCNVVNEIYECNLEHENVNIESASSSADDFGGNVGEGKMHLENSSASEEISEGNVDKELVVVESIVSDEDLEFYGGDQSTILEDTIIVDEDLDPIALEPDVIETSSLKEASHNVDKEDIWSPSVVSEVSIIAIDEISNSSKINSVPSTKATDVYGYDANSDSDIELSTIEKTRISNEDVDRDIMEIPVVDGTLTSIEEMTCDNGTEYVALKKTSLSELIHNEDAQDFSSMLINSLDAVSGADHPFADENSNQESYFETRNAAGSPISAAPNLSAASEGDFCYKCNDETNMMKQDTLAIATSSTIIEDTEGRNSVAAILVATQRNSELTVDEKIDFDIKEPFLSTTGVNGLNLTDEKATSTTEVAEVDILRNSATAISISEATEPILAQLVADREQASPVRFCLSIGAALLPQTSEALTGGEDAYFIAGEAWFGVADGVGQWSLEGIDDGLYAHELMENCRRIVSNGGFPASTDPKVVLSRSAAEAALPGSATVLVAYFDGQVLHASNIGDTGFIIVRNGVVLSKSSPTVHDFHFPHQIQKGDDPLEFVQCYEMELDEGDIIVAATDGLFDNMYDQEISSIVTKPLHANWSPKEVAAVLAVKAQEIGRSTSAISPFADAAHAAGYASYTGGKLDDVAVIVSVVQMKS